MDCRPLASDLNAWLLRTLTLRLRVTQWLWLAPLFIIVFVANGTAMAANSSCFTIRSSVVTPNREAVFSNLTNGAAGRNLVEALLDGDIVAVGRMLTADPRLATTEVVYNAAHYDVRPVGQYGDLLTLAVGSCHPEMLAALLDMRLPPDGQQIGSALSLAVMADTPVMAELLLRAGASPDPQKRGGANVAYEVMAYGNIGAMMTLIRYGLDMVWVDEIGNGHLQIAVDMEQYRIAELMVDRGAKLWQVSGAGAMPVQNLTRNLVFSSKQEDGARIRLIDRAKASGLPWPPPTFSEVTPMVKAGKWPTQTMQVAGMRVPVESLAHMQLLSGEKAN